MDRRTFISHSLAGFGVNALGPLQGALWPDEERMFKLSVPFGVDAYEMGPKPVVVGLGAWGERLVRDLADVLDPRGRTSIYMKQAGSHPSGAALMVSRTVSTIYEGSAIVILAFSRDDVNACESALRWCHYMQEQDIPLKAAVVRAGINPGLAESRNDPVIQQFRMLLNAVIIQPGKSNTEVSGNRYFRPDIQSVRILLLEGTCFAAGLAELKEVFNDGKLAVATSARALPSAYGGDPGDAIDSSLQQLGTATVDGAFVRWIDGIHCSMIDYDLLAERLIQRLPETAIGGVFVDFEPELNPGEPGLVHALWTLR